MQQEIKLTSESSNTVFVDDVDVRNGVYAKSKDHDHTLHLEIVNCSARMKNINGSIYNEADSLPSLIYYVTNLDFYTIPDNKRIVTKRELTVDDLKNTDHVGFVTNNGQKGHIVYYDGKLQLISTIVPSMAFCNYTYGSGGGSTMADAILKNASSKKIDKVYRFTERTGDGSLYEWLNKK